MPLLLAYAIKHIYMHKTPCLYASSLTLQTTNSCFFWFIIRFYINTCCLYSLTGVINNPMLACTLLYLAPLALALLITISSKINTTIINYNSQPLLTVALSPTEKSLNPLNTPREPQKPSELKAR